MRFTTKVEKLDKSLPRGVYPKTNKIKKPSKTMEVLMGRYEQQLVRLNLKRNLGNLDKALYRFFGLFPYKSQPEDFTRLDIEAYKKDRLAYGYSEAETEKNIGHICAFFNYLIDYEGYFMMNPASKLPDSYWKKRLQEELSLRDTTGNTQVNKEGSQS